MAGRPAPRARQAPRRARSQHFLRSRRLAAELVRDAAISPGDVVVEIGAGTGLLTDEVARRGALVYAIELDPALAARLRRRARANVVVVEGDALAQSLPGEPFKVVANLPFDRTTAVLRHLLDDPSAPLVCANVVVEWGAACKRAAVWPSTLLGVVWGAWFTSAIGRRLPAACFVPRPSVDAGVLAIYRRPEPLVEIQEAVAYRRFVRAGFDAAVPLRSALAAFVSPRELKRAADRIGFERDARPWELDAHQWASLFRSVRTRTGSSR